MNLTKPQKLIYDMEKFAGGAIAVICGSMLVHGKKELSEIKRAASGLYRLNTALRIRIVENDGEVSQTVCDYAEQDFNVLCFDNKAELDGYAEDYAKKPLDFYGNLCEINIVSLPKQYGLLIKLHHIIGDAWTLSLLGTQFNKLINGEEIEAYSYTDYVESENVYIQSKRYEKDKAFFVEQFKKCDEVTYLSEKQSDSLNACRKTFVIGKEQTSIINTYAQQKGTSAFMLFTAALSTYMNRVKMNAEKFYIGTAVLNRSGVKENNTVGMFVNTAPMLMELDNSKSFAENLSAIEDTAFSVFRHQKYNYGDVLSTIRKEYNFTEKLYDVMISYQNATVTGGDIETTWHHSGSQSESLQIHIDDRDNEGIFRVHYDYLTDKFTKNAIERLHQHICNLLFDAIGNDSKKLYELNILSADEKRKLLYEFNNTTIDYPRDKCVHQLFEEQVSKTPEKVAVIACDKMLTYAELNEQANRIAHSLIEKGVSVGDIVAFALPRKSLLIATIFGVLKAGAAYLPVDPDYPHDRIDYMIADSNAKLFVTEDNIKELLANDIIANPSVEMSSNDLCYCIYTSGSTGQPKGTLLKHQGIVNLVTNADFYSNLSNCEHIGFMTTITFDVATQEILTALLNGFTGVLMPERKETKIDTIINGVIEHKVDVIYATPTYFDSLTDTKGKTDKLFSTVKVVCLAGEGFYLNDNASQHQNILFENHYGPAETHVATTDTVKDVDDVTIGKPIANTQIYIVDQYMQPTPIGVTGELCIAGDGVGAGYLNRPELTTEKFIDNPFGEGKLYKTGDLAYWHEDGNIAYVGRNDFQVKIRGLRIELGEIENAICGIDGISQAVVVVRKNNEGRQLICAFYTGAEVDSKDIRSHIGKKLPKYMLPHICTRLDEMPLTSSGKINRKALPEVDLYAIETDVEYVAPTTKKEIVLVSAIQATLGIDKVGIMDNFFDVGGDSLKAIELISKLEKNSYHTDTKTIFECDTVKELAEKLTAIETEQEVFDYSGDIPATDAQMRVYTAQSMNSDSTTYNVPYVFKVDSIDIDRLQNAVDILIARHESLRTHFENKNGNIIQIINETVECAVEKISLPLTREVDAALAQTEGETTPQSPSATAPLTSGAKIEDVINSFIRPFDLSKAPLLRVGVYKNTVMIDMHHIITDGGSMPVFLKELNELYMGRSIDTAPVQYKQFALQKQDHTESEKYWLSVYSDEVPVLEINTDYHRGQKQSFNGSAIYDSVDIELHNKILAFCKAQNITPYVFYMSGFNILLSKFSGNEDIVVGMPISGRDAKYLDTIGMFVNTIALRNKPVGTKSVVEFLQEVKENSVNAINHQDYPYGELIKKLDIHTPDRNPLFDVMFAYQSEQMTDVVFGDKKAELLPVPITTSKYDFTFNVMPRDNDVVIMAEYCTDLYKEQTIQRFIDGYKLIIQQLMNSKNLLKDISPITEHENNKLLYEFNDTAVYYPRDKCVHQLFENQVAKTPDNIALKFGYKAFTFAELNGLANGLATKLQNNGVGNSDVVAIISKRSYHIVVAMLAIFKCGAAYLPIDYNYPTERIYTIANDAGCKVILTYNVDYTADNTIEIPEDITPVTDNLLCQVNPQDICGIIYTSGSTGTPKGTLLHHQGLVNYTYVNNALYEGGSCNIGFAIYTFDAFFLDLIPPMLRGKTAVMATEEEQFNQIAFENLIKNNPECNLFITPAKFKQFVDNRRDMDFFKKIHSICIGGEVFPQEFIGMFSESTNVFNVYGPTECSMWMLECQVVNEDVTLGKPMGNVQVYIVDKNNKITPIGVTGELCIAGDGVGAGYLNRPELTAEKFIDNPFGDGKLYKTGDLAYWLEDGNIAYVGRNDFQVKIRGLRIELGEIENAICGIDGISQAVVVVRKNNEGRQLICAFYTGAEVDAKDIRNHIGKKLPKYMLPHICTHLDEMPLTSSGKINRKALPEVDLYTIDTDVEYVAPVTEQEKILVSAIEATLGIDKVGIMDNFFDIGGDSLKAIELIAKLEKQGYHTDTKTIFDCETVKELAERLYIQTVESAVIEYGNIIPATAAQMRVYTAQGMDEQSTLYNIPYAFKVDTLDAQKLENAVNTLIDRHESLRTHFENQDGRIVQVIDGYARITVTELESEEFSAFVTPFDLTKSPLIRVGYYENTVIVDMHHIICDGGTMPAFFRELNELYMGRAITNNAVQYGEFAVTEQNTEECEKYWLSVFNDEVPVLELPTDFNRTDKQSFNGNAVYNVIDTALHNKIIEKCKQLGITPYVFYMSGFNILLSKFSGNEDIVVGMPISGRDAKYLDTVGMFVNTIALRSKPEGNKTVADLLNEVKVNSVAAIDNQNYPFGELVKKLHIDNSGRNPLFDVMFAYQSEEMTDIIFGDQKAELLPIPVTTAKCDFTFNILPRKSGIVILVEYCTDLYKQETIQRFVDSFKLVLEQCLDDSAFIKNISAISEKEHDVILNDFNDTATNYPMDKCVHQLVEEQVAKTPDEIAVIACDKTLTYAELNEQTNRIAHSLIEKGIDVGDIVAFALPRKSYLIATMLGILKAGAAYLPVDPDYPQDRIDYMLSDSNAKFFITEDNIQELLANDDISNPSVDMSSNCLCYCIYTSGSTGKPKGTLLKHQGIVNLVTNLDIYANISNCERIGFMTTITFDVATQEILTALLNGFTGVLMPERKETRADAIIDGIVEHKIDVMYATPTYFDSLTDTKEKADRLLSAIKVVCLAGEKFSLNNNVLASKDNYNVIFENQYGPVELHVIATATTLQNNDFDSIGKPVGNDRAYIVDKYMQPTPIGVTGELCIAGDGVGAGYLNRPELTAEKFIDNPFGKGELYKTGDLAYWREDGNIVYVGRNDFQVKIRGLRIELGEIENAICSIDGISQAVVVVRKNNEGRQLICAFYTGAEIDAKDVRNHIGKKLPKYMLPHICTHLDEMPLTSSGKINRKALPEIDLANIANDTEYVAPETQMQKELCKLIEVVLGTTPVGITDDFFDLGGDSLKAIEFVSKAHNEGIYFNLQNVFDYPTVKELWECIENGDKQVISFADVDFSEVNKALAKNKVEYITGSKKCEVGNILLAGATGYLGIHILADFLDNDKGVAYCLVRGNDKADSTKRLQELLDFYFGDKYADMNRIVVICADLQKDKFGLTDLEHTELLNKVNTVINCAASVKHYGSYKYFYEANVETTKRLIEFCKGADAKLIHTSTLSVSGNSNAEEFTGFVSEETMYFNESSLYIEQPLDNVYARSKFEAEKAVLDAMTDGLQANIMRMGNLSNRLSDGVFQINHESNAALQRVKGMLELGVIPDYLMDIYCEFTPIDEAANAVMTIARHFSAEQTVFHVNTVKVLYIDRLLEIFNELGFALKTVSGAEFTEVLRQTAKQTGMEHIFETFINDMDENDQLNYDSNIRIENDFTVQYLKQFGFEWADIGIDYLRKYVEYFKKIGYLK